MHAAKNFLPGASKTFCRRPFMPSLRRCSFAPAAKGQTGKKKPASEKAFAGSAARAALLSRI